MTDQPWITYTPTISQGPTISKIIHHAHYGRTADDAFVCEVDLQVTDSGVTMNTIYLSKPYVAPPWRCHVGTGLLYDVSANRQYAVTAYDEYSASWRLDVDAPQPGPTLNHSDRIQIRIALPPPTNQGDTQP